MSRTAIDNATTKASGSAERAGLERAGLEREGLDEESARLARTEVTSTLRLAPVGNVLGDLAGVLGEHVLTLMGMFYPRPLCRRANVVVTELVTNVLENVVEPESELRFDIRVSAEELIIEVGNRVTDAQYKSVLKRIKTIRDSEDVRDLLKQTIRERRPKRLKGGLGFMRLAAENKFELSSTKEDGYMTIRAVHRVRPKEEAK